jgi:hypothetical protein
VKNLGNVEANHRGTEIQRFERARLDGNGATDEHHISRFDGKTSARTR